MVGSHRVRDSSLIDALEAIRPIGFAGAVWRVVRAGRDVLIPSSAGGRWDDGTFDVLYTSQLADGAVAEMDFHVSRGQPVIPSRVHYHLYELRVAVEKVLQFVDLEALAKIGVETSRYGALSYGDRDQEYPRTQDIAETAQFVGFDGLLVPNARWNCKNLVIFSDRVRPDASGVIKDHGRIDWERWKRKPFGY
jgi:hypothetical protein